MNFPDEVVEQFKFAFARSIDQFTSDYTQALKAKDFDRLSFLTHSILPNLKMLQLHSMVELIKGYRDFDLEDPPAVHGIIEEIEAYRTVIKDFLG